MIFILDKGACFHPFQPYTPAFRGLVDNLNRETTEAAIRANLERRIRLEADAERTLRYGGQPTL